MIELVARNWGWVALRGVAAVLFGVLTLACPAISLATLVLFFGYYALADGICTMVSAITGRRGEVHWLTLFFSGLIGAGVGVVTLVWPGLTAIALLLCIAGWAMATGVFEIVAAIRLRKVITGEWLLASGGVLSVLFGLLLVLRPRVGALAVTLWIGAFAVVFGVVCFALALRLRKWHRGHEHPGTPLPA